MNFCYISTDLKTTINYKYTSFEVLTVIDSVVFFCVPYQTARYDNLQYCNMEPIIYMS